MKITIDVTRLLATGQISKQEHDRFVALSKKDTGSHAVAILGVMAAIAVAVGFVGLNPKVFSDAIGALYDLLGAQGLHLFFIALLLGGGTAARSGFLVGLSCFVILSFLGGSTFYSHASYFVSIKEPALAIIVFTTLSIMGLAVSYRVQPDLERLAFVFSRTCLILVNMGFWIGSLWGSKLGTIEIDRMIFVVAWALALLLVGVWGAKEGRRFVVNTCATFGAIHFYTQWFERLGATPGSLLISGIIAIGILYLFKRYNSKS